MHLAQLLAPWMETELTQPVNQLKLDSRQVGEGDIFVAIAGHQVDGRQFIAQAVSNGAVAVLSETQDEAQHGQISRMNDCPVVAFYQLGSQLSALAARAYPLATSPWLVGVTGTNGKTSITHLIAELSLALGAKPAVMGTVGNGLWGALSHSENTTSDPITIGQNIQHYVQQGADIVAMEVSSHGLVQGRVSALPFNCAVFTNLSRDHLDYHQNMHNYALAKKRLFQFDSLSARIFNVDDEVGKQWFDEGQPNSYSVGVDSHADYTMTEIQYLPSGIKATLHWFDQSAAFECQLIGQFNVQNMLCALAALHQQGMDMHQLIAAAKHVTPVAGRMEQFSNPSKHVVVDYAHTPEALTLALETLKSHCRGRLWVVFGCGGDRDVGKRPLMAKAASALADRVILTADNPRSEQVIDIITDMQKGLTTSDGVEIIEDRKDAIKIAIEQAASDDIVLVAGKGHEDYQEIMGTKYHYDERAYVQALLKDNQ